MPYTDKGLSRPEKTMAKYMLEGKSATDSYLAAFRPKGELTRAQISSRAGNVTAKPDFKEYYQQISEEVEGVDNLTAAYRRQFVVAGLMREARAKASPAAARIRALELIGKMHDVRLFTDAIDAAETMRTPAKVEAELRDRLKRLAGEGQGIILGNVIKDIGGNADSTD